MSVIFPPYSGGGGGGGGVASVNGDTGPDVLIDAADVGAVPSVSTANRVYATGGAGQQTTYAVGTSATATSIAQRGVNGTLVVGEPQAGTHATTKSYVDAINTALDARLDALETAGFVASDGSVTDLVSKTEAEMAGITPDATTVYAVTP